MLTKRNMLKPLLSKNKRYLLIIIFSFLFFSNLSYAQNRENYQLLWEIKDTVNDRTSYLFGTMHIKDKRVFNFSDALLPAIKNTEVFALEVHPDSIMVAINSRLKFKTENIYKEILTTKEYEKLNEKYLEMNGISFDSLTFKSPFLVETNLEFESVKEDDMPTFLDAYLYGIANSLGKEINGLESASDFNSDYENITNEEIKTNILDLIYTENIEYENYFEDLVSMYIEGDLDKLFQYITNGFSFLDVEMIRRNMVMVSSLKEIMKEKTVFSAVGAAHLPGPNGVISLLRKEGYVVTKVSSPFTGKSNNYIFQPNTKNWHTVSDDFLGYKVTTPVKPETINFGGLFDMQISIDLSIGASFGYLALDLRTKEVIEDEIIFNNIIETYSKNKNAEIIERNKIVINDIEFLEIIFKINKSDVKILIASENRILYFYYAENYKTNLASESTKYFFDSIKIYTPIILESQWHEYTNDLGAFSVLFPEKKFIDASREVPNTMDADGEDFILNMYYSTDLKNETIYFIQYYNFPLGYFLEDENEVYEEFEEKLIAQGTTVVEKHNIITNGIEGVEFSLILQGKYHTKARIFYRGNRNYLLMAQKMNETEIPESDNPFFNSLKLLKYKEAPFKLLTSNYKNYAFSFPEASTVEHDTIPNEYSDINETSLYFGLNEATGGVYLFEHSKLKKYFRVKNIDSTYKEYRNIIKGWNDSIIKIKDLVINGIPSQEVYYSNPKTNIINRTQFYIENDNFIIKSAYLGKEEIDSKETEKFFSKIYKLEDNQTFDVYSSKANLIFKDLRSKDTIQFNHAQGALGYYSFYKEELPLIEKQLSYNFKNDTLYSGIKNSIIRILGALGNENTLLLLKDYYLNKKTKNIQRLAILETMPQIASHNTLDVYFNLLKNNPPERNKDDYFLIFNYLNDSTQVFINNIERLLTLKENNIYRDKIISKFNDMITYDSIAKPVIEKYKDRLVSHFRNDLILYLDTISRKENVHINYSLISNYINIVNSLKIKNQQTKESIELLIQINEKTDWLKTEALITSLNLDYNLPLDYFLEHLEEPYSRYEIMEAFINNGKESLIPDKYLQPLAFSKLSVYNNNYDYYSDNIEELGLITYNDIEYYAFSLSFGEDEEKYSYLGVSELKSPNFEEFKLNSTYFDWDGLNDDWKTQAISLIEGTEVEVD